MRKEISEHYNEDNSKRVLVVDNDGVISVEYYELISKLIEALARPNPMLPVSYFNEKRRKYEIEMLTNDYTLVKQAKFDFVKDAERSAEIYVQS
jgi:hypothetical protein